MWLSYEIKQEMGGATSSLVPHSANGLLGAQNVRGRDRLGALPRKLPPGAGRSADRFSREDDVEEAHAAGEVGRGAGCGLAPGAGFDHQVTRADVCVSVRLLCACVLSCVGL